MRLGHIDRFSIVLMPMCDIVSLKTDSRSNWPVAALMESSSILPCSSGILDVGSGEETRADFLRRLCGRSCCKVVLQATLIT